MKEITMEQLPVGWNLISEQDNEMVLRTVGNDGTIYAKVRLVTFVGSLDEVAAELGQRAETFSVIDSARGSFLLKNTEWVAEYYVCSGVGEKYHSFFYAVLDGYYLVFELVTDSNIMRMRFCSEAKRLIQAVNYSQVTHENRFVKNGKNFCMKTPSMFRFSNLSTDTRLVFVGESKYLFVNVEGGNVGISSFVESLISMNYLGVSDCDIEIDDLGEESNGVQWVRCNCLNGSKPVGKGTYFSKVVNGETIVSYLFEQGKNTIDVANLVDLRGESDG